MKPSAMRPKDAGTSGNTLWASRCRAHSPAESRESKSLIKLPDGSEHTIRPLVGENRTDINFAATIHARESMTWPSNRRRRPPHPRGVDIQRASQIGFGRAARVLRRQRRSARERSGNGRRENPPRRAPSPACLTTVAVIGHTSRANSARASRQRRGSRGGCSWRRSHCS